MANIYNWKINQLDAKIHEEGLNNVIYTVHWTLLAEDDAILPEDKLRASNVGCTNVELDPETPFIPYSELTKDDVIGWLDVLLPVDNMKMELDREIELQKNPVDEFLHPDWDSQ